MSDIFVTVIGYYVSDRRSGVRRTPPDILVTIETFVDLKVLGSEQQYCNHILTLRNVSRFINVRPYSTATP